MILVWRLAAFLVLTFTLTALTFAQETTSEQAPEAPPKKANARPSVSSTPVTEPFDGASIAKMAGECVTLETEAGKIEMEMLAESAPETVRNFLNLAATGFFDTTTFSRIVKGFVVQGGNLSTRSAITLALVQRAKRTILDEPNNVKHVRGIVSMARADQPNSATTNFFILVGDASHLDGKFAAFGRVVRGMDVVDEINHAATDGEKPLKPVHITRAVVAPCTKSPAQP